jgi:NAD+ synthetase
VASAVAFSFAAKFFAAPINNSAKNKKDSCALPRKAAELQGKLRYTRYMKLALAQINPTVGDFSGNAEKIIAYAQRAAEQGAELAVFSELCVCGYPPADLLDKPVFIERALSTVAEIAAATAKLRIGLLIGTVTRNPNQTGKRIRNSAVLIQQGKMVFDQHKRLLPFYDVFDEQRYFAAAERQQLHLYGNDQIAVTICEDAWNDKGFWLKRIYTADPVEDLMHQSQRGRARPILINLSASPWWKGKAKLRRDMLCAVAKRHGAVVVMVNQVGGDDSLVFDGGSLAIDREGRVIAQARSFDEDLVVLDTAAKGESVVDTDPEDIAATYGALVIGTRDYVRKCGFTNALVGLSGGIDSALVATIAVDALGAENVTGIGMPSEYSSTGSIDDSRQLAENLGIRFEILPIRSVFEQEMQALQPFFADTFFGLAEENLQSRIRGTLLMAVANKFSALVLTTGNKSEMATGYCTLYGDMVGALAVIGDVYKTRVYVLARYANREREIIPIATIEKPPSAELRPNQKDTDSLPPYDLLDPVLEAYIEHYEPAEEIAQRLGLNAELVASVLRLVERSEYKRQQAAPVLKVTSKSFGMGRRFPIAVKAQV